MGNGNYGFSLWTDGMEYFISVLIPQSEIYKFFQESGAFTKSCKQGTKNMHGTFNNEPGNIKLI
jgi:hypothetical protein